MAHKKKVPGYVKEAIQHRGAAMDWEGGKPKSRSRRQYRERADKSTLEAINRYKGREKKSPKVKRYIRKRATAATRTLNR